MAKQPLPPQVICQILGLNEEIVKASFEAGTPPTATEEQLVATVRPPSASDLRCLVPTLCCDQVEAVKKSVDPGDTVDMYAPVSCLRIAQDNGDQGRRDAERAEQNRTEQKNEEQRRADRAAMGGHCFVNHA